MSITGGEDLLFRCGIKKKGKVLTGEETTGQKVYSSMYASD